MDVREKIRGFIADAFFVEGFDDDSSFLAEGLIDSMGLSQLVAFIEAEFGIEIADQELTPDNLDSVERVARLIDRKTRRSAA